MSNTGSGESGKLRWGILGTGNIAKTFASGVARSQRGVLVAVGSRSQASADAFAEKHPCRAHATYEALLADAEVQAIYISTPHPLHAKWAVLGCEAGKHLLVEKPLTLNHGEAMQVVAAAERHGVFLMEAFMYRCHPQIAKVLELIRSGVIGDVRFIDAKFGFHTGAGPDHRLVSNALGGGAVLDVGCYAVSAARLIAGAAQGKGAVDPVDVRGVGALGPTGVDEWATASLRFESGVVATVSCAIRCQLENHITVYGTRGRIVVTTPWIPPRDGGVTKVFVLPHGQATPDEHVVDAPPLYAIEADFVAEHVHLGQAPSPGMTLDDSLGNMLTLDRWRQSMGLRYESERPERCVSTVTGRPLSRPPGEPVPMGRVSGVNKPVSRLVMGVDNQSTDDQPHANAMFDDFFERGGNCFDCAYVYWGGKSEPALGHWMRSRGVREQVVVLDKGAHTPHCNPKAITEQHRVSLDRLQTDHVDLYMMHRDNPDIPVGEFVDALNEHLAAGTMKAIGGSNWSLPRVQAFNAWATANGKRGFDAISNNFSLARMVEAPWAGCLSCSEPEFREWLERTGTAVFSWSSQARGFFTGRAGPDKLDDPELVRCWYSPDNFQRLARAQELAHAKGATPIQVALAYVLHQRFPTFALIGPRSIRETHSSLGALGLSMTDEEARWLDLR